MKLLNVVPVQYVFRLEPALLDHERDLSLLPPLWVIPYNLRLFSPLWVIPNDKGDYFFLGESIGLPAVNQNPCHYVLAYKLMHEDVAPVCSKCRLCLSFPDEKAFRSFQDNVYLSVDEIVAQLGHSIFGHVVVPLVREL